MTTRGLSGFSRLSFSVIVALTLALLLSPGFLKAQRPKGDSNSSARISPAQVRERLDRVFTAYKLVELDLEQAAQVASSTGRLTLDLDGVEYDLVLQPNDLRSPLIRWTRTTDNGEMDELLPPVSTYKGFVESEPNSQARFLMQPDLFFGYIRRGNDWLFIDPVYKFVAGARPDHLVVYREADVRPDFRSACGASSLEHQADHLLDQLPRRAHEVPDTSAAALRVFEVATDADYEFFQTHGSQSNSFIEGTLNQVDGIYEQQLGLTLKITSQNVYTTSSDPYTSTNSRTLLDEFTNHWNANRSGVQRDVAHLFSGKDLDENIIGRAWIGVTCNIPSYAYGLSQDYSLLAKLTAHEIGHNFDAEHDNQVTPPASTCDGSGPIMCSWIQSSGPNQFSDRSKTDVGNHVSNNNSCLDTESFSVSLAASPRTGSAPLSVGLTADVSGSATGTINYTFWWNCSNSGTSVSSVMAACGSIPTPAWGTCTSNTNGMKCDGITDDPKSVSRSYSAPGTYTAKVIAERGSAAPVEARVSITVSAGCGASPITIGQTVNGTLSTSDCRSPMRGDTYYADRYSFSASAGQQIAIALTSSAFDSYVYLISPSGSKLAEDDDGAGYPNSRIPAGSGYYTLPSNGTYIIEATAFSANTIGNYTLGLQSPEPPPTAPSNLAATAVSSSQINVTWRDNANNETEFRIERKTGASGAWSQISTAGTDATGYSNTGLSANTTYYYRVRACNLAGCSGYSAESSATTSEPPPGTGTLQVRALLNGRVWSGRVNYTLTGPTIINGASVTARFTSRPTGTYTLVYNSGGPTGARLITITPSATQTLNRGRTITFTLNFSTR
jgi:hypothetical protein